MKRLLWVLCLAPVALVANLLLTIIVVYSVFVVDIYINTEKLSKVDPAINAYCENIARNPKFTKGPVVFRVDKGTLVFRLSPYFNRYGIIGYAPFFIFPHHQTVVIDGEMIKSEYLDALVAHELGHIQGGLAFLGTQKDMEKYANSFELGIIGVEHHKGFNKYLEELVKKESQQ